MPTLSQDHIFETVTVSQFKKSILPLRDKLYRFALSYVKNRDEAADVVQDVMVKTWEDIDSPASIRNIEAWCMTLVRNKSLDQLKRKGRNFLQIVDQYDLQSDTKDPLEVTQANETRASINEIIADLPPKQRDVISLRDLEGYSYKEIAEILEIDVNNVKVLLHRARMTVREALTKMNAYGTE